MDAAGRARAEISPDLIAGKHGTGVSAAKHACLNVVFGGAAPRRGRLGDEMQRLGAVEKVVGAGVHDNLDRRAHVAEPFTVTPTRLGGRLIVRTSEQHKHRCSRNLARNITRIAAGIEGDVSGKPHAIRRPDATYRLECGGERHRAAARESHERDAGRIDTRMSHEQAECGVDVRYAGCERRLMPLTPRGVKLSTTKTAMPIEVNRSAQATSRSSETPPALWLSTTAGTRSVPAGRRRSPLTTVSGV